MGNCQSNLFALAQGDPKKNSPNYMAFDLTTKNDCLKNAYFRMFWRDKKWLEIEMNAKICFRPNCMTFYVIFGIQDHKYAIGIELVKI